MTLQLIAHMKKKTALSAAELYVMLDREFRRRRPAGCERCEVTPPLPVRKPDGAANWELLPPPECPEACHHVLDEVACELARRYDLAT
jgi:hypothetical protein